MSVERAVQSLALFLEENSQSKSNEAVTYAEGRQHHQTGEPPSWTWCSSRTEVALNTGIGYESYEQNS